MRARPVESEAHRSEGKRQELIARVMAAAEKWQRHHDALFEASKAEAHRTFAQNGDNKPLEISVQMHAGKIDRLERLLEQLQKNIYSEREVEQALRDLESGSA